MRRPSQRGRDPSFPLPIKDRPAEPTLSIEVVDYHKSYGSTIAVAGITFRVSAGEILGLVGPNGAGKTTTLRALAGILTPTRGRLSIDGHDLAREPVAA